MGFQAREAPRRSLSPERGEYAAAFLGSRPGKEGKGLSPAAGGNGEGEGGEA